MTGGKPGARLALYRKPGFEQEGVQRRACRRSGEGEDVDEILMVRFLDTGSPDM
jgi:hypothetical protein